MSHTFTVVTMGCPKNTVMSEQMIYRMEQAGYTAVPGYMDAEIIILNTCGFIDSAKAEAVENILELLRFKEDGTLKKLIVVGCLAELVREEITEEFPDVDGLAGCGSYDNIVEVVESALRDEHPAVFGDINAPVTECGRTRLTAWYSAYVRIAEGCNNRCSYCIIPSLKGNFRSREEDAIVAECEELAADGVKELNIIAQDITRYGEDLEGKSLVTLLRRLCRIDGIEWIRLHYLYPAGITDELIDLIAEEDKICNYLDIPMQHCNDQILKAMNRRGTKADLLALVKKLREKIPGVILRTSLIVGLPGETEEIFEELCDFCKEVKFERVGVFSFSPQEGTVAASLPNQVDEETAEHRKELLYDLTDRIMTQYYESLVGKTVKVLCEGFDRIAEISFGRSYADSPEIDGKIFFKAKPRPEDGEFIDIIIEENYEGELFGSPASKEE
ncbi:MAG: 30S ribosomal protein S12 methylthiotransferase RimO [Ruminococcaceae bacterium]|nr:30S ribosomal protein S12 methylthiotransferase RimO [Oscillospiraceae bacterium]